MTKRPYTLEEEQFLLENYKKMTFVDMAIHLNRHPSTVSGKCYRMGLKKNVSRPFSSDEIQIIRDNFRKLSWKTIGEMIGRSSDSVKHKCHSLGLKRTDQESIAIQKFHCSKTQFKKGHLPHNTRRDGDISIRPDKRGIPYKFIRVEQSEWIGLHIVNWEKAHGPVPDGSVVRFKDGNSMNCELDNLELMSKAENLEKNNGREELTDSYVLGTLSRKDKSLRKVMAQFPELIELKRNELKLRRTINE
jgi:hypothetical protein